MKFFFLFFVLLSSACSTNPVKQFQEDADLIRLEHLEYWSSLIEQYHNKNGYYPMQKSVTGDEDIVLVRIATKQQMSYLSADGANYDKRLDNNPTGRFNERSVKQLVAELEQGLAREIDEKYDIQKVPTSSPVGYNYFVTKEGYLTCTTCGVTRVSTLLGDGYTPTDNIVSEGMAGKVPKALTREEMLQHPTYKLWVSRAFHRGEYVHNLVKQNYRDSK